MSTIEIESSDVIRLIQQFFKENNLVSSLRALQQETTVTLNTVEDIPKLTNDVLNGRWGNVLQSLSTCSLPDEKQEDLFEQIILELLEMAETDTCQELLQNSPALKRMEQNNPNRYLRLRNMTNQKYFDPREAYPVGTNKEKKRNELVETICREVQTVSAGRLLSLLGQSVKWQQHTGQLPKGAKFDLFRGDKPLERDRQEKIAERNSKVIKFGKTSCANSAAFSPDGQFLVTGSSDGFIEIWDFDTGKLRKDLKYQAEDELMLHESAVQALGFSRDSELIVSGSKDGRVKVWRLFTGECLMRFDNAHQEAVTAVGFDREGTQVLSASNDKSIRVHGLRSGRQLKQFLGHESYVNDVIYSQDCNSIISCSSDGTVKVWLVKSTDCVATFKPSNLPGRELAVHKVCLDPGNPDQVFACIDSNEIVCCKLNGIIVRKYSIQQRREKSNVSFVNICTSARGQYLYAVGDDQIMYVFNIETGDIVHVQKVHTAEVLGITHHPHRNIMTSFSLDRTLKVWRV